MTEPQTIEQALAQALESAMPTGEYYTAEHGSVGARQAAAAVLAALPNGWVLCRWAEFIVHDADADAHAGWQDAQALADQLAEALRALLESGGADTFTPEADEAWRDCRTALAAYKEATDD